MKKTKSDPKTYWELSTPFASRTDLDAALVKFMDGVEKLRLECRVPDVSIIAQATAMVEGEVTELYMVGHYGNRYNQVPMLAQALGRARGDLDAAVGALRSPHHT